jgi:hypothetical protein
LAEDVLHRKWQTRQPADRLPFRASGVNLSGPLERGIRVDPQKCTDAAIQLLNTIERRTSELDGRDFTRF